MFICSPFFVSRFHCYRKPICLLCVLAFLLKLGHYSRKAGKFSFGIRGEYSTRKKIHKTGSVFLLADHTVAREQGGQALAANMAC